MVSFVCEGCQDVIKKSTIRKHKMRCHYADTLTCIDCSTTFYGNEVNSHTSCISEAEKYQGALFKGDKKKKNQNNNQNNNQNKTQKSQAQQQQQQKEEKTEKKQTESKKEKSVEKNDTAKEQPSKKRKREEESSTPTTTTTSDVFKQMSEFKLEKAMKKFWKKNKDVKKQELAKKGIELMLEKFQTRLEAYASTIIDNSKKIKLDE